MFFNYPLNLCKWLDPECQTEIKSQEAVKISEKETAVLPDKVTTNNHSRINDKEYEKKALPISFTLSIQLRKESEGYEKILYKGKAIGTLPESTTFNPRIEILNYMNGGELIIVTKAMDTCKITLPNKPETSYLRIVPNCI